MDPNQINQETDFIQKLKSNELTIPNEFTIELGKLVKKARDEIGYSQSKLAQKMSRRQATISDIENGKSEVGILTLVLLSLTLNKPISYFIPGSLIKHIVFEDLNPLEEEALNTLKYLEYQGDPSIALEILKTIAQYQAKVSNSG